MCETRGSHLASPAGSPGLQSGETMALEEGHLHRVLLLTFQGWDQGEQLFGSYLLSGTYLGFQRGGSRVATRSIMCFCVGWSKKVSVKNKKRH